MTAEVSEEAFVVLVTGSRDLKDRQAVWAALDRSFEQLPAGRRMVVRHGKARRGADLFVEQWALRHGEAQDPMPADWEAPCRPSCRPGHRRRDRRGRPYCPAQGDYRNQAMVDKQPVPSECLSFFQPGALNKGTRDCTDRANRAGIHVVAWPEGAWGPRSGRRHLLRQMTQDSIDMGLYDTTAGELER